MKSWKRYLIALGVLIFVFLLIYLCVHFLSKGFTNKYNIDSYSIKEIYTKDEQDEDDNYYIEITANNIIYNYQFYKIEDDNKIVKDILYYDGEYKCLLPLLSDNIKVDFLCYKEKSYYNYSDIKGKDDKLDKYIKKLDKEKYDVNNFLDKVTKETTEKKITYYKDNIPNNYVISITSLKGIVSIVDGKLETVDIFDKDIYTRDISIFVNNYYVTADYNEKQIFDKVYVVNTLNGDVKTIKAPDYISFDSYIQGYVDNSVYLYDLNNEVQYKIDINENTITIVGDSNKGIRYHNGNWSNISAIKANNRVLFKDKRFKTEKTYHLYHTGNKLSGFYYYYFDSNEEEGYEVYKSNSQNKNIKKYIFNTKDYNNIVYLDEYIFFKNDNKIKLYSDYTGVKTIISSSELEYNDNIKFTIYKK